MDADAANRVIMAARAHWFPEAPAADGDAAPTEAPKA
jgi:hypothetical protein